MVQLLDRDCPSGQPGQVEGRDRGMDGRAMGSSWLALESLPPTREAQVFNYTKL